MRRVLVYRRNYLKTSETFIYEQLVGHQRVKPVVLTRIKPINTDQFPYKPIFVRKSFVGMASWLKKQRIRCLHARYGPAGLELLGLAKKTGIPLITSFHGFDATKRVKTNPVYRKRLRHLFRSGQAFTVVSNHMRRRLIRLGCPPRKITIIRSGIDLKKFPHLPRRPVEGRAFRLLSVGRLTEKKGMDTLIKAFSLLRRYYPHATLTIVGDGDQKPKLLSLIRRYKLSDHITFTGALPHKQVQQQLKRCHLFVIACKTARDGNQEGIPNVLMEAMATGRPVVSTRHAGIPELVTHKVSGFLAPENSPHQLAQVLKQALAARASWPQQIIRARKKVEQNHDIRKQRKKLETLYLRVIQKKR